MNNGMLDFKPFRSSGYTGNRHDDKPESLTAGQGAMLGFIAGAMMVLTLSLFVVGL